MSHINDIHSTDRMHSTKYYNKYKTLSLKKQGFAPLLQELVQF